MIVSPTTGRTAWSHQKQIPPQGLNSTSLIKDRHRYLPRRIVPKIPISGKRKCHSLVSIH